MTPNQQREELSKAYVAAVAAQCGYKLAQWSQDDDCVDLTIGAAGVIGAGTMAGPKLDVQLKCSSDPKRDQGDRVAVGLKRSHYERLRAASAVPMILVVVILPADPDHWLTHSPEELVLRRCGYWRSLRDAPPLTKETSRTSTVSISKSSVFSPDALRDLMERRSRGEAP